MRRRRPVALRETTAPRARCRRLGPRFRPGPGRRPLGFSRRRPQPHRLHAAGMARERWSVRRRDRRPHTRCGATRSCSSRRAGRSGRLRTSRPRRRLRRPPASDRCPERGQHWADRGEWPTGTAGPQARWYRRQVRRYPAPRRASPRGVLRRPARRRRDGRPGCRAVGRGTGPREAVSAARLRCSRNCSPIRRPTSRPR